MNRMWKAVTLFLTVLEILAFAGAYALNYFTNAKMGMARYVIYMNQKWSGKYPLDLFEAGMIAVIAAMAVGLIVVCARKKEVRWFQRAETVAAVVLSVCVIGYLVRYSVSDFRSYYFVGISLVLASFLQNIKTYAVLFSY